jgi:hypothetical protein
MADRIDRIVWLVIKKYLLSLCFSHYRIESYRSYRPYRIEGRLQKIETAIVSPRIACFWLDTAAMIRCLITGSSRAPPPFYQLE